MFLRETDSLDNLMAKSAAAFKSPSKNELKSSAEMESRIV